MDDEVDPALLLERRIPSVHRRVADEPRQTHQARLPRVVRPDQHGDRLERDGLLLAEALEVLEGDRRQHALTLTVTRRPVQRALLLRGHPVRGCPYTTTRL